jgi:hypothetical protein
MVPVHKNIKRFYLEGSIGDEAHIPRLKDQHIAVLGSLMEKDGYARRYDIDPDFTVLYNGSSFDFRLSVYGVYVGKRQAQCLEGVDKNRMISKPTQRVRSEKSLSPVG